MTFTFSWLVLMVRLMVLMVRLKKSDATNEVGAVGKDGVGEDKLMTMVGWLLVMVMVRLMVLIV